jgi:hypothetical protein
LQAQEKHRDIKVLKGQDRYTLFGHPNNNPNNMSVDLTSERASTKERLKREIVSSRVHNSTDCRLRSVGMSGVTKPPAIAVKFENIN